MMVDAIENMGLYYGKYVSVPLKTRVSGIERYLLRRWKYISRG
jgi:hypothetical protein